MLMFSVLLSLLLTCGPSCSAPSIRGGNPCGATVCAPYQYCSVQEHECKPCEEVCRPDSHDQHQDICENQCQDYLHDVEKGYATIHDVKEAVSSIFWLLIVILILLILVILMVGGLVYRKVRRYTLRKLRKWEREATKEKLSVEYTPNNNNNTMMDGGIRCISQATASTMPSTMTLTTQTESPCSTNKGCAGKTLPLSSEEPSEDTTLDYASYINQGMTHSPSNENGLNTTPRY